MRKRVLGALLTMSMLAMSLVGCAGSGTTKLEEATPLATEMPTVEVGDNPVATIKVKDLGTIEVVLYPDKAPQTVENFISLANSGFYDGLIFHRVINGFMIQGGDPEGTGAGGPGYTIPGEFAQNGFSQNDISHDVGVISMARTNMPDTAGSQFFIVTGEAKHLDGQYAAFGRVIAGQEVADAIQNVETGRNDKPVNDVIIESVVVDTKGQA